MRIFYIIMYIALRFRVACLRDSGKVIHLIVAVTKVGIAK